MKWAVLSARIITLQSVNILCVEETEFHWPTYFKSYLQLLHLINHRKPLSVPSSWLCFETNFSIIKTHIHALCWVNAITIYSSTLKTNVINWIFIKLLHKSASFLIKLYSKLSHGSISVSTIRYALTNQIKSPYSV